MDLGLLGKVGFEFSWYGNQAGHGPLLWNPYLEDRY